MNTKIDWSSISPASECETEWTPEERARLEAENAEMEAESAVLEALQELCTHSHELSLLGDDGCEHGRLLRQVGSHSVRGNNTVATLFSNRTQPAPSVRTSTRTHVHQLAHHLRDVQDRVAAGRQSSSSCSGTVVLLVVPGRAEQHTSLRPREVRALQANHERQVIVPAAPRQVQVSAQAEAWLWREQHRVWRQRQRL